MTHVHLNTRKIIHHIILWVQNQEKALVIMIERMIIKLQVGHKIEIHQLLLHSNKMSFSMIVTTGFTDLSILWYK
jgi:hypothetical protein